MSEILERLRRLHGLREQKRDDAPSQRQAEPTPDASAAPQPPNTLGQNTRWGEPARSGPQRLSDAVPGATVETEAGACYVSAFAYPLTIPRGDHPLGDLLSHLPRVLDQLVTVGIRHAEKAGTAMDYSQAAFIDTETSGLGTGSCCFMVGVGTFEALPLPTMRRDSADENANGNAHNNADDSVSPESGASSLHEIYAGHTALPAPLASAQDATHFVVRQFFMRHPGEETALLAALATTLTHYNMTVTFNGRAFDLPLLRSRYRLHRHFLPATTPPPDLLDERRIHLDLLPPARRLWRRRLQSCRLINLEQKILHLHRSEDDVPGHLIPMLYVDFTRSGDARAMRQVFYHNREDIVSMVGIATHLTTALNAATRRETAGRGEHATHASDSTTWETRPSDSAAVQSAGAAVSQSLHGHEWLALGQHYARQKQFGEAIAALQQAAQTLVNPPDRALALGDLAALHKRAGDWDEACATWQLWISSVPGHDPTPYIELAKHCEWQSRDLAQAEMWTAWALHNLQNSDPRSHHRTRIHEVEHRLQRIRRKRASE